MVSFIANVPKIFYTPFSSNVPRTIYATPLPPVENPASESSGPAYTSPVKGRGKARVANVRRKQAKKAMASAQARKQTAAAVAQIPKAARITTLLSTFRHYGITIMDVLQHIFDPSRGQGNLRWQGFFNTRGNATQILDFWVSRRNPLAARTEVSKWAQNHVEKLVRWEARGVSDSGLLRSGKRLMTLQNVLTFDLVNLFSRFKNGLATVTTSILEAISVAPRREETATDARAHRSQTVATSAALACFGEYSHANNFHKRVMSLYLYATGSQRQQISVLSHVGITESYTNLVSKDTRSKKQRAADDAEVKAGRTPDPPKGGTLKQLSDSARQTARNVASLGLYGTVYDNINMSFRNAEQVIGRHDSQENGTCATIWPLWKAAAEAMTLKETLQSFDKAPPLTLEDILHTPEEAAEFEKALVHCILRIAVQHGGEKFKKFQKDLDKTEPASKHRIDVHRTDLHPLPAFELDESTITGNAMVDEAIVDELKGGYTSFRWGIWMPGLFHGKIADMHGMLNTHWGKPNSGNRNPGSLSFHNTQLNRLPIVLTSLPTFRVCRDLVFVSLYARVSGQASLDSYVESVNDWDTFYSHAKAIYDTYTSALTVSDLRWKREMSKPRNEDGTTGSASSTTEGDMVYENALLFLRDALISREYTDAIKVGDSGRVLLVLKAWTLGFRGNGRTKYAYEMLHIIHNLAHVWPKAVRNIVLNNWLLCPSGNPRSFVEVDLVQEHMNFWIKSYYKAHGSNASWEWLAMIAPCVQALRHIADMMKSSLGIDIGTQHTAPDLMNDINRLMQSLDENNVYKLTKGRVLDDDDLPVSDVMSVGLQNLTDNTSNPLTEFNKAFSRLQARRRMTPVVGADSEDIETISTPSSRTETQPIVSPTFPSSYNEPLEQDREDDDSEEEEDIDNDELAALFDDDGEDDTLELINTEDVSLDMDNDHGDDFFAFEADI
ncbi:hypothetical protein C8J56DRAFT_999560 [Mycena floridula]|nr:hypothetical protein C8J56DRAFT_999560 [Mycena floridula]